MYSTLGQQLREAGTLMPKVLPLGKAPPLLRHDCITWSVAPALLVTRNTSRMFAIETTTLCHTNSTVF